MNIFVTDISPILSAKALDDKRVLKMIVESAQLLSGAMTCWGHSNAPYRPTHLNHPCAKWTRENKNNYMWLLLHFEELLNQYEWRFHKNHKCKSILYDLCEPIRYAFIVPPENFVNVTSFKELNLDTQHAYKLELLKKWANDKRPPKWTNSTMPDWAQQIGVNNDT